MPVQEITPVELNDLGAKGAFDLYDVRTPAEFEEVHATDAISLPLDQLTAERVKSLRRSPGPIYLICRSGGRGRQGCEKLIAAGVSDVVNVSGGTQAWERAGLSVVRGRPMMSLERQVRIVAGLLVLIGTMLGAFVHPVFLVLSGFIGAGLVFAGITDTCGMGMMLAKMPWNQRSAPQCVAPKELNQTA